MLNGKLIQLLQTLSKKELKDFQHFVASDYHNSNEPLQQFLRFLGKYEGDYNSPKLNKEAFFKKHYPHERFDEQKFRYLQSDLTQLLEEFLSYTEFRKDKFQQQFYLTQSLQRRNANKFFLQELQELEKLNETAAFRDSDYYLKLHKISEIRYEHSSENRNRAFDNSLQELIDNLEITYLARGFRYYCEMINRRNILSVNYNLSFFDELVKHLRKGTFDDIPAIFIYRLIHCTLTEPDEIKHYNDLLEALQKYEHLFSRSEARGMYVFAQNFCIRRINSGDKQALDMIFSLYKVMVSKNLIFEGNFVSQPDFKNIVTTGLRLGADAWVGDFIEEFHPKLNPQFSKNAYTYSMAWVHFARREYDKALRMLLKVEFNDVYYHLDSKSLLMKVYFELDEYDAFASLVDAFKIYLRRNQTISDVQKKTYHNFILLINKLMKFKLNRSAPSQGFLDDLESLRPAADIPWLRDRTHAMTQKFGKSKK
jgi:hypothetical protein